MTGREFEIHLAKTPPAPLYFLYGEEQFLIERYAQRLLDHLLPPQDRDFNLDRFQGGGCTGEEILTAALSLPLFSCQRVVWIRHAEELSSDAAQSLVSYMENPNPSTSIVLQAEKIDARRSHFVELKKRAVVVECKKPRDDELVGFIVAEARRLGKGIRPEAAELLALLVGPNFRELSAELEKALLHAGENGWVEVDDIRSVAAESRAETVFSLTDAIGERDVKRALKALSILERDGASPVYLVTMIVRYVRQLWLVRWMLEKGVTAVEQIAEKTGIKNFVVKKLLHAAKKSDAARIRKIYPLLLEADLQVKGGGCDPFLTIERLVVQLCGEKKDDG